MVAPKEKCEQKNLPIHNTGKSSSQKEVLDCLWVQRIWPHKTTHISKQVEEAHAAWSIHCTNFIKQLFHHWKRSSLNILSGTYMWRNHQKCKRGERNKKPCNCHCYCGIAMVLVFSAMFVARNPKHMHNYVTCCFQETLLWVTFCNLALPSIVFSQEVKKHSKE